METTDGIASRTTVCSGEGSVTWDDRLEHRTAQRSEDYAADTRERMRTVSIRGERSFDDDATKLSRYDYANF